ncbi:hypothetical protein [Tenuifilum osseticum]|uniref:hypothetical protein n=1 Tax=Tenuifilum osseticum TaxID=3374723 RepID=UPI0034E5FB12
MKPLKKRKSNSFNLSCKASTPYLKVNSAFALILLLVFIYSLVFSPNTHPIPAALTQLTGIVPPSKGLSAAFSQILRLNFTSAYIFNPYGLRVFSFFLIQFILRVGLIFAELRFPNSVKTSTITVDILISLILLIYCFYPLIEYTFKLLLQLFH